MIHEISREISWVISWEISRVKNKSKKLSYFTVRFTGQNILPVKFLPVKWFTGQIILPVKILLSDWSKNYLGKNYVI